MHQCPLVPEEPVFHLKKALFHLKMGTLSTFKVEKVPPVKSVLALVPEGHFLHLNRGTYST